MMGCCTFFGSSNNKPRSSSYSCRLKHEPPENSSLISQKEPTYPNSARISLDANDVLRPLELRVPHGTPISRQTRMSCCCIMLKLHIPQHPHYARLFGYPHSCRLDPPLMILILKSLLPEGLSSRAFALLSACFSCSSKFGKLLPRPGALVKRRTSREYGNTCGGVSVCQCNVMS